MDIESYAKSNLQTELEAIEKSRRKNSHPELTSFEKAVIYKYSDDGFL
jgi:hypothetical protein